jgi:hypothetical protein
MRRLGVLFVALAAGCFNQCDYSGYSCPASSEIDTLDGRTCDPDKNGECGTSTQSCVCESGSRRWHCETLRVDFSAVAKDLSVAGAGCASYVSCLLDCYKTQPNASEATCTTSCAPAVSGDAVIRYGAATSCVETNCLSADDAGAARCQRATDGELLNEDGTPRSPSDSGTGTKRCNLCLHDGLAGLYGTACTQPGSADCKPAACTAAVDACLNP